MLPGLLGWSCFRLLGEGLSLVLRRFVVALVGMVSFGLLSGVAVALPEGRVYEMVSPPYKGGYSVSVVRAVAPDGDSVAFGSFGGFGGQIDGAGTATNMYLARRGPSGWATVSLQPPFGDVSDLSADLGSTLGTGPIGPNVSFENHASAGEVFQLHRNDLPETASNWEVVNGLVLKQVDGEPALMTETGASPDLCHIVVGETAGPLLPEAVGEALKNGEIYDLASGCGGESWLRVLGLNNQGIMINPDCPVELGLRKYSNDSNGRAQENNFDAIAAGGSEIFFTTAIAKDAGCEVALQLFARLGGSRTIEVSKPLSEEESEACREEVPCPAAAGRASAYFAGASEDGSRVFFTTTQQLTGGADGDDLYMATIACPGGEAEQCEPAKKGVRSLVLVSRDLNAGEAAEVQGVTKLARDGSRMYFVARGILSEGSNPQGAEPVSGADNLYVYDSMSGKTGFVADLCSGPALSGLVDNTHCPRVDNKIQRGTDDMTLWSSEPEAQTSGLDGRFLVFSTYAQLLPGDTDDALDVYRYDAESGVLVRVSVGEAGSDANGNCDDEENGSTGSCDAQIALGLNGADDANVFEQYEMHLHAISEDGSRIVFTTFEPLSPAATNGSVNIYEWHDGTVSLVSTGSAEASDDNPVISPSGQDVFFTTTQALVSADTDDAADVYDARLGGGFAPVPAPRQPCSGDACQGPLTNPVPLLVPGSVSQAPGENFPPAKKQTMKKAKAKKKVKAKRKAKARAKGARHGDRKGRIASRGRVGR